MLQLIIQHFICSAGFIVIYTFFLQKQKTFVFNRYYLLSSLLLSVLISFIHIPIPVVQVIPETMANPVLLDFREEYTAVPAQPTDTDINWKYCSLLAIYLIGVTLFLTKLIFSVYTIYKQKFNATIRHYQNAALVLTDKPIVPHSFLNTIYLNKNEFEHTDFPAAILTHEYAHIQQRHSLDILLTEVLQTALWFNPFIRFYKKAIKLNHEFMADEVVVQEQHDISNYQYLLLNLPKCSFFGMKLSSQMNFIITKKRFMMMTKKQNLFKAIAAKSLTLLLTICIAAPVTVKLIAQEPKKETKSTKPENQKENNDWKFSSKGFNPFDFEYKAIPEGTTNKLLLEFQQIVNETGSYKIIGKDTAYKFIVPYEKRKRVDYIVNRLTREEIKKTRVLTMMKTLRPPKKEPPTATQFENFKNSNIYGVWIDDKKVPNEKLNDYQASDFVHFFASKFGAAKKGRSYSVQVNLSTQKYFEETWKEKKQAKSFVIITKNLKWSEAVQTGLIEKE